MEMKKAPHVVQRNNDVIEIPIGKFFVSVRHNPWITVSFILGLLFVFALASVGNGGGAVSESVVRQNVLTFLNSNPQLQGQVELLSVVREGSFYTANVDFNGQQVPVYVTLDGNYLLAGQPVPLNGDLGDEPVPTDSGDDFQTSPDDDAVLGDPNAPVTIIEFSDYQCPYCKRFWQDTLPQLKSEYIDTGKVKLIYRDYPLPGHPMAQPAAEASECIREKGGDTIFWKYHDKLFENQATLSEENMKKWAKDLGFDISSCLDNGDMAEEVNADFEDGGSLGTPTFFVNGVKLEGALPFAQFKQVIDSQLSEN